MPRDLEKSPLRRAKQLVKRRWPRLRALLRRMVPAMPYNAPTLIEMPLFSRQRHDYWDEDERGAFCVARSKTRRGRRDSRRRGKPQGAVVASGQAGRCTRHPLPCRSQRADVWQKGTNAVLVAAGVKSTRGRAVEEESPCLNSAAFTVLSWRCSGVTTYNPLPCLLCRAGGGDRVGWHLIGRKPATPCNWWKTGAQGA